MKYGSFVIDSGNSLHTLMFTLNEAAVSGINAAVLGKKTAIAISGAAIAIPEPSTWIMMLAGFAGLGLAAYRGAARGRAAISGRISRRHGLLCQGRSRAAFLYGDTRGVSPPSPIVSRR